MNERDIDEIVEKVCSSIYIQENHLTGETSIVGLENVKVALQEERKQAAVEACQAMCYQCKDGKPVDKAYRHPSRTGFVGQSCIAMAIRKHFSLTNEDFPKEPKWTS